MDMVLRPLFVKTVPPELEQGVLYISEVYGTAIHLCACGICKQKTVTPFHNELKGWKYTRTPDDLVTLYPSIGNFQMPCRSHYWITENKVVWC
jgi:hypothetical protein